MGRPVSGSQLPNSYMHRPFLLILAAVACAPLATFSAQSPAKVDFGRDVQPIFASRCYSCRFCSPASARDN